MSLGPMFSELGVADIKAGEPFGLDGSLVDRINWDLALKRIVNDVRSDFIYAPHLMFLYLKAAQQLVDQLKKELKSGAYSPGVPITMEVPKSFRMRIAAPLTRFGPSFTRPGSILLPKDRIFYQALADQAAPIIKSKADTKRSFSHRLAAADSASMFLPTRYCWNELQKALAKHAASKDNQYILKLDVANFFGSIKRGLVIRASMLRSKLEISICIKANSHWHPYFSSRAKPWVAYT